LASHLCAMGRLAEPIWRSVKTLALFFGSEDLEIIDARGMDFFLGYIPGSRRFPIELFNKEVFRLAAELAESAKTVIFVDKMGGACAMSCALDFTRRVNETCTNPICKVYVLEGGFRGWEAEFSNHVDVERYITRSPVFPGAPHAGLNVRWCSSTSSTAPPSAAPSVTDLALTAGSACKDSISVALSDDSSTGANSNGSLVQPLQTSGLRDSDPLAAFASLAVGDLVWIFNASLQKWIEACVIAIRTDLVKVQWFAGGKCCLKAMPKDPSTMRVERPED